MKTIILTGGGTAGHIMPNIALLNELKKHYQKIYYIGSNKMEKEICKNYNIEFFEYTPVKFERKISLSLFKIPFKLIKSINRCKNIIRNLNPSVIFSKGGYVSLPVCIAGNKLKIPVITHESDLSLGLANKLIAPFAKAVCTSFRETTKGKKKFICTGTPIREQLFKGKKLNIRNFDENKKTVLFLGGSTGAKAINNFVEKNIDELSKKFNILHITGKTEKNISHKNYHAVMFAKNIEDYFKTCNICICRSGANTIFELLATQTKMILIPLPKGNSRGDQVENAEYFKHKNYANVCNQELLSMQKITFLITKTLKAKMPKIDLLNNNKKIVDIINKYSK